MCCSAGQSNLPGHNETEKNTRSIIWSGCKGMIWQDTTCSHNNYQQTFRSSTDSRNIFILHTMRDGLCHSHRTWNIFCNIHCEWRPGKFRPGLRARHGIRNKIYGSVPEMSWTSYKGNDPLPKSSTSGNMKTQMWGGQLSIGKSYLSRKYGQWANRSDI